MDAEVGQAVQPRLDETDLAGMVACADGMPITENPFDEGSLHWLMWRLAYLREQEREAYEDSIPRQAERALEQQPLWERREKAGINELIHRVIRRTAALGELFGIEWVPSVILEEHHRLLRESVEDLLSRTPTDVGR